MAPHQPHSPGSAQSRPFPVLPLPPPRAWLAFAGWGLLVSGDLSLWSWQQPVMAALRARFPTESTRVTVIGDVRRLFKICEAFGVETWNDLTADVVSHFCWAPRPDDRGLYKPISPNTARMRRRSALACFEEAADMGAPINPETLIGPRISPPSSSVSARPLSFDEEHLFQQHADSGLVGSRRSLIAALSYAGGTAPEVASVRFCDIDVGGATVTFRGDAPRTNALPDWSAQIVERWYKCLPTSPAADALVCVTPGKSIAKGARSIGTRLGNILTEAGIRHRSGVSAESIRRTGALHVFKGHGIEAAARFLGNTSLDRTAGALRHNWRDDDA